MNKKQEIEKLEEWDPLPMSENEECIQLMYSIHAEGKRNFDKERISKLQAEWYQRNRQRQKKYAKEYHANNREKARERTNRWRKNNPERSKESSRKSALKVRQGISFEEYISMYEERGGLCDICSGRFEKICSGFEQGKVLSVDHCHKTGFVRGLLCHACNAGIGNLRDSIRNIEKALEYLRKWNGNS